MRILITIPSRMGSSRFPGKPMHHINGVPMIGVVYKNISNGVSNYPADIVVATCDEIIFDYINSIGGHAIMTSDKHERASDRCAEAMIKMETDRGFKYDLVVMVQGDEPMTTRSMVDESIFPMVSDEEIQVLNLMSEINSEEEFNDRNCIKVVCDNSGNALYFSREPIPTNIRDDHRVRYKQVCIIPFRREALLSFNQMKQTPLEKIESIDMLRLLENKINVKMIKTKSLTYSVDTLNDLKKVEKILLK